MDEHEALLDGWSSKAGHAGKCFIRDGIIDRERWDKAGPRVLLLLKEAYGTLEATAAQSWDLRLVLRENAPAWQTWLPSAYWCHAIHQLWSGRLPPFPEGRDGVSESLRSSAIVNIKKSGGRSRSDHAEIERIAREDGPLIRKQIDLIDPQIVVCGYTWGHVRHLWGSPPVFYDMLYRADNRVFVDFWHPSNRYPKQLSYYALAALLQNSGVVASTHLV